MDARANLCLVTVNQGYDAAATSIVIVPTDPNLSRLPTPTGSIQYDLVWWDDTTYPGNPARDPNAEFVRVTGITSNTLTVTRAQQGTTATDKNTFGSTYSMMLAPSKKYFDDLDNDSVDIGEETKYVTELTSLGAPGAAGDGVTVDTTAIQDHVTEGNYVVFPPGTYILGGQITLHSNLVLVGNGIGVTTIKFANSVGASSMFKGTTVSNVKFVDMTLDGNKSNNASALDGVELTGSNDVIFENCEFKSIKRHGVNLGCGSALVDGCRSSSCDGSGVYVDADNCVVTNTRLTSNAVGITVNTGADDTTIKDCYFASNTAKVTNSGTNTHARGNVGWKTQNVVESTLIDVSTTGEKQRTIAHGLDVTPTALGVLLGHYRSSGTGVYGARGPYVESVDATNVVCSFNVTAAIASTEAKLVATINALP